MRQIRHNENTMYAEKLFDTINLLISQKDTLSYITRIKITRFALKEVLYWTKRSAILV